MIAIAGELADLDTDVEEQHPHRQAVVGQAKVLQARRQTETVDEAEGEDDRPIDSQLGRPTRDPPNAHVDDAERDHDIDERGVELPAGQGPDQQRNAVSGHKQRDQLGRRAHAAGDQHDAEDEVSQAGFDGDLVSRILSSGEESLRGHGTSEEISR